MGSTIGPSGSNAIPNNLSANAEEAESSSVNAEGIQSAQDLGAPSQNVEQPASPTTQERVSTQRFNTSRQISEFGLGGQMRELQLKQLLGSDSTAKAVPLDTKALPGTTNPTPELRFAGLKDQLDAAKIPAKVRDELLAQGGKLKGDSLEHFMNRVDFALKGKDATGEIKSLIMEGRMDSFKESFNSKYEVNGKTVQALPHFRIGDTGGGTGHSGPAGRHSSSAVQEDLTKLIQTGDKAHWNTKMQNAVHMVAYGRGNAEQIQMVTQSLIRGGQFDEARKAHPGLSDSDTIRMMQWDHGIGIDCAGYVQQAFVGVHGGDRAKYGLQPRIGDENLMNLKSNRHFHEVKPTDVKPGDLIALNPPPNDAVGHTILVTNHHEMGEFERKFFTNISGFAGPNDKVHVYSGDASWSGGTDGDLKGGVQRRMILYNETTGKWADVTPTSTGYDVQPSSATGPYNHPMNGIYRPKGE